MAEIQNAKVIPQRNKRIILAGEPGSGKTAQILTLPPPVLVYVFDPNSLDTLAGHDIDILDFRIDPSELETKMKAFRKDSNKTDIADGKRIKTPEPRAFLDFTDDINMRYDSGELDSYNWVAFDSATFLTIALHERLNYLNNNMGGLEDLGDYRIIGKKLSISFLGISKLKASVLFICHLYTIERKLGIDKPGVPARTLGVETMLNLPGSARTNMSSMFTDVWETVQDKGKYKAILQHHGNYKFHRTSNWTPPLTGESVDLTIDFNKDPRDQGIGKLVKSL